MWNRLAPYVLRLFGRHGLRSDKKELRIVKKRWGEKAEWEGNLPRRHQGCLGQLIQMLWNKLNLIGGIPTKKRWLLILLNSIGFYWENSRWGRCVESKLFSYCLVYFYSIVELRAFTAATMITYNLYRTQWDWGSDLLNRLSSESNESDINITLVLWLKKGNVMNYAALRFASYHYVHFIHFVKSRMRSGTPLSIWFTEVPLGTQVMQLKMLRRPKVVKDVNFLPKFPWERRYSFHIVLKKVSNAEVGTTQAPRRHLS